MLIARLSSLYVIKSYFSFALKASLLWKWPNNKQKVEEKLASSSVCYFIPSCRYYYEESFEEWKFAESKAKVGKLGNNPPGILKPCKIDTRKRQRPRTSENFITNCNAVQERDRARRKKRKGDRTRIKKKEKFFTNFASFSHRLNYILYESERANSFFAEQARVCAQ